MYVLVPSPGRRLPSPVEDRVTVNLVTPDVV